MNKGLEEQVQEQMITDVLMPRPADDRTRWSLATWCLRASFCSRSGTAGLIHWGKHKEALSALQADPLTAAMSDMAMRAAALDCAHFYIGFAVLPEHALGEKP
jgi:hypothetical protein